ncbi:MAG: twin-arginine translocation signal domain-containing protein [Planctomycetota bacterium]
MNSRRQFLETAGAVAAASCLPIGLMPSEASASVSKYSPEDLIPMKLVTVTQTDNGSIKGMWAESDDREALVFFAVLFYSYVDARMTYKKLRDRITKRCETGRIELGHGSTRYEALRVAADISHGFRVRVKIVESDRI